MLIIQNVTYFRLFKHKFFAIMQEYFYNNAFFLDNR